MMGKGKVRRIMSPAPVCMASAESVSAAAQAMREHGTPVGVVSIGGLPLRVDDRGRPALSGIPGR